MSETTRLMMLDEVLYTELLTDYLWLQTKDEPDAIYHLQVYCHSDVSTDDSDPVYIYFNIPEDTVECELAKYGRTWRCWTAMPSEQQRQAVKWDG